MVRLILSVLMQMDTMFSNSSSMKSNIINCLASPRLRLAHILSRRKNNSKKESSPPSAIMIAIEFTDNGSQISMSMKSVTEDGRSNFISCYEGTRSTPRMGNQEVATLSKQIQRNTSGDNKPHRHKADHIDQNQLINTDTVSKYIAPLSATNKL